jgi:hypothetical protein
MIFTKRLKKHAMGKDMKNGDREKGKEKRTEQKEEERRWELGIGDGPKSSHATPPKPTSLPTPISARSNRATVHRWRYSNGVT